MQFKNTFSYRFGAWLWVASLQYYVVQLVVAAAWSNHKGYNWANNTISDLANTHCGPYGERLVCSPLHPLMNASFILLGLTMIGGSLLLVRAGGANRIAQAGFGSMILAGMGTIIVGLFPENSVSTLHVLGAALPFIFGNIGMIVLGYSLKKLPRMVRLYSVLSGGVGSVALGLFVTHQYVGLGLGGLERVVSYPQSIWMIVVGCYVLITHRSEP
jgi:hypothetical membrane protein